MTRETKDFLISCIESNEDLVELGYHENESFINDVAERYESNLEYGYNETDAKDDAIRAAADFWAEINRIESNCKHWIFMYSRLFWRSEYKLNECFIWRKDNRYYETMWHCRY